MPPLRWVTACLFWLLVFIPCLHAEPATRPAVPEPLEPWVEWALHGHDAERRCPPRFDDPSSPQCHFPTRVSLSLDAGGGGFVQEGMVYHEAWVPLVGDERRFPEAVLVNGSPAVVLLRNGAPRVKLSEGPYRIEGRLNWPQLPDTLALPAESALVSLTLEGQPVGFPDLDEKGRLWIRGRTPVVRKVEDTLSLHAFRLIEDDIPATIRLHLTLDVAGAAREVFLGPAFSPEILTPLSLESGLPARVEPDGRIRLQARPGRWELTLLLRHTGPLSALSFHAPEDGFWPREEIWSFAAQNELRMVELEGAPAIDPLQTRLPEAWRRYPAFRLVPGETLRIREVKRGDPQPAPDQMSLERELWLRFDGGGYTLKDTITGKKHTGWRLEMTPEITLGRVVVDGTEQFITRRKDSPMAGVELRRGLVRLSAESAYTVGIGRLPLAGWDQDFEKVTTRLHLPPGWRLVHATGMDNVPATWLTRWTLLDLFVVLVFTIAAARLYSKPFAVLALVTLVLIYPEPGAPRWIWPVLLAGFALLKYLPKGGFRLVVWGFQALAALALLAIAVPFAIHELRVGIYPQLEKPWQDMGTDLRTLKDSGAVQDVLREEMTAAMEAAPRGAPVPQMELKAKRDYPYADRKSEDASFRPALQVTRYDPSVVNQTGPGLPAWQWNSVVFTSGPTRKDQRLGLTLAGPGVNRLLSFARVLLLAALALGLFGVRYRRGGGWFMGLPKAGLGILVLGATLALAAAGPSRAWAAEFPSQELLEELKSRLLEKADCFPGCAAIASFAVQLRPDTLALSFSASSPVDVAMPLPGSPSYWLPGEVTLDGEPVTALFRTETGLWMRLPAGTHAVKMTGKLPPFETVQLPLPLPPHRVDLDVAGWRVEGVHEDGTVESQLQFKRLGGRDPSLDPVLEGGVLPAFTRLERTLFLGLTWKVHNHLVRVGGTGSAVVLEIPLLAGESVVTPGLSVKEGRILVQLDARSESMEWESTLAPSDRVTLFHENTQQWTEVWQVDASPIFHMEHTGIPVVLHQQGQRWVPRWHPWPGETVVLSLSRPEGVPGQTLTIDKSHLVVRPGQRATDSRLTLSIRSSQGGQHPIELPEGAQLEAVEVNGKTLPIRQENRRVQLPVTPGAQEAAIQWRSSDGISTLFLTPRVDVGTGSVNAHVEVHLPQNRWPLFFRGPRMGPAILFWSVVAVVVLGALGLAKTGRTPLRFRHWLLLGIGMSQGPLAGIVWVVGWLMALDLREHRRPDPGKRAYNWVQMGLVFLTAAALSALVFAISRGLLGHPDMNIVGNGSSGQILRWYQDHNAPVLPQARIVSIPMFFYRLAMMAWALWVAAYLIGLLRWGWRSFSRPVLWANPPRAPRRPWVYRRRPDAGGRPSQAAGEGSSDKGGEEKTP